MGIVFIPKNPKKIDKNLILCNHLDMYKVNANPANENIINNKGLK